MKFLSTAALAALAAFAAFSAAADEGMWTFDNPPAAAIEQKYGVKLDSAWLNHVRESTVRLRDGLHRLLHFGRRPDPHEPPLRRGLRLADFLRRP
jgi:hypothetical protein